MKTLLPALTALTALSSPALAHSGVHVHPHGSEPWSVAMGVALIVTAAVVAWRRT